tara:strand:+ start:3795 stop:4088 length:294 start_codon:yes stop_codon:yes gene_type:complete
MDPTELLAMGSNGVVVAAILAAYKAHELWSAKKNGGSTYSRVAVLESKVDELTGTISELEKKLTLFHRDFMVHRENVRLHWARIEGKEQALREVSDG